MNHLLATGFVQNFLNDPLNYLWKGILVIFVATFLVRFAIEQIKGN